jgi:hypothetical protein
VAGSSSSASNVYKAADSLSTWGGNSVGLGTSTQERYTVLSWVGCIHSTWDRHKMGQDRTGTMWDRNRMQQCLFSGLQLQLSYTLASGRKPLVRPALLPGPPAGGQSRFGEDRPSGCRGAALKSGPVPT